MYELAAQYFRITWGKSSPLVTTCSTVPGGATAVGVAGVEAATAASAVLGRCEMFFDVRALAEYITAASRTTLTAAMVRNPADLDMFFRFPCWSSCNVAP
jgi:hypothetical protein